MSFIAPYRVPTARPTSDPAGRPHRRRRASGPRLEVLEDRTVLSTLVVQNNADSGSGSLRAVIAAAQRGDTIVFAPKVHDIVLTSGELDITQNLNIDGPSPGTLTIQRSAAPGTPSFRIFDISGAGVDVSISGVTIANGLADGTLAPSLLPGLGGGIDNVESSLSLTNDVVRDNQAVGLASVSALGYPGVGAGGGINNLQGILTITDCTVADNQAIGGNGSLFGVGTGGAINNAQGVVTVVGSTLVSNQAIGGDDGSGPFFNGLGAGGAIANNTPSGGLTSTLTVIDSVLGGNEALGGNDDGGDDPGTGVGGAIHNGGTATVISSTFIGNMAQGGTGNTAGSSFVTGPGGGFGGAILNATGAGIASTLRVTASAFVGNVALGGDDNQAAPGSTVSTVGIGAGGGIINGGGSSATITASFLGDNVAEGGSGNVPSPGVLVSTGIGGGFVNGFGPSVATFTGCVLIGNQAEGGTGFSGSVGGDGWGGGLVNTTGGTATVTDSVIDGNQAIGGTGGAGGEGGDGLGGGLIDGTFGDNVPQSNPFGPSSVTMIDSTLTGNLAQGGGGGPGGAGGDGLGGGAFIGPADLLSLTGCAVTYNDANGGAGGSGGGAAGQGMGGGVYNLDPGGFTFDITTIIASNTASTSNNNIDTA
jgi:hypothetical protein